jgi:PAS domain S-box-containing protein
MEAEKKDLFNQHFVDIDILNQFEAIFKYANEGIIITNSESQIIKMNPAGLKMFGYNEEEIENQFIEKLIPKRYNEKHIHHRKEYQNAPKPRSMGLNYDLFGLRNNGSEFPVEVSLSPFKNNQSSYVICFIIDITTRKKAEESEKNYRLELEREVEERTLILKEAIQKLEKTKIELDKSLKREQETNSMKTKFISIASHEFRTPLSTVLSSLSLVEKYSALNDSEKRAKHIDRIKKSIRNLTDILNDILSVNKIEEGKVIINPIHFNLNNFMVEILSEFNGLLKEGQEIKYGLNFDKQTTVHQDPKLLRPILVNLITNAIKFSKINSEILVEINIVNSLLSIKIQDFGIGIPKEDQEKLFTRFFRCSNADTVQGTGLGLSIVNQYVNYLKGSIKFESDLGKGSTFIVFLPKDTEGTSTK